MALQPIPRRFSIRRTWGGPACARWIFASAAYGRLEFTVDGEDYYAQYMPVGMQEMVAPPDLMLAQMTYAGVDHAVLQAGGAYGAMTSYNCYTSIQYPRKFTALLHVDEAMGGTPEGVAEVERGAKLGAKGLYFNFEGFARHGFPWPLDHAKMDPLWDRLQALGLVLCAEISSGPTYDVAGYVRNMLALGRVLDRFPRLPCHLAMGVPVQFFARGDRWDLPQDLETVYKRDDFYVEIMYPDHLGRPLGLPLSRGAPADPRSSGSPRRRKVDVGLRHAQCRALLHLSAVARLRPALLRFSHRG